MKLKLVAGTVLSLTAMSAQAFNVCSARYQNTCATLSAQSYAWDTGSARCFRYVGCFYHVYSLSKGKGWFLASGAQGQVWLTNTYGGDLSRYWRPK